MSVLGWIITALVVAIVYMVFKSSNRERTPKEEYDLRLYNILKVIGSGSELANWDYQKEWYVHRDSNISFRIKIFTAYVSVNGSTTEYDYETSMYDLCKGIQERLEEYRANKVSVKNLEDLNNSIGRLIKIREKEASKLTSNQK